eukprot:127313-Karenia_brevis.AAC.1
MQESINRAMFYVWADKKGTCRDRKQQPAVAGNYQPAWVEEAMSSYRVKGAWPLTLWQQYKLSHEVYEEYLFKCRDNVVSKKRNLDAVRQNEENIAEEEEMAATTKRVRSNPNLFRPFVEVPAAVAWLQLFLVDALRYPILVVLGASGKGKTEWAQSLFRNPLVLKVGGLEHFPDGMRTFRRGHHDGLILDDIRDMLFLTDHQDKLQG